MVFRERLLWFFSFIFLTAVILVAVYTNEAGIAAIFGMILGSAYQAFLSADR